MPIFRTLPGIITALFLMPACSQHAAVEPELSDTVPDGALESIIDFETYHLENGLTVVLHIDRSDPVVAVALTSHVGSAREVPGRTGFAHLFEHLLFLESENLGKGGLDKMSARIGGSGANGSTSRDRTNYFQTVPNDALEKMIWAEADKLGYFINTVTEPVLAKEKQVVKNEKRLRVDNQPYGHVRSVVGKNMYAEDHPYNWQVIGSLADLQSATLQDVKDFYNRWYVPNNVTLVIAGNFDTGQAREWVQKYFGEIARGEDTPPLEKRAAKLTESKRLYYEDNFARLPELRLVWPTVYQYHPDSWALNVLAQYLSDGKNAPLNQVIVDEKKLASEVSMFSQHSELAGEMTVGVRAFSGTDLNEVQNAFEAGFERFEAGGISERDLNRIKISQEVSFYDGIGSVIGKAFELAQYQIFANDPGFINQDIRNIRAVSVDDVMRVYETYIQDSAHIATSFVPLGQVENVLSDSIQAQIIEEEIVLGAEEEVDPTIVASYERTLSTFDRTVEPPYGAPPVITVPRIWQARLTNGLDVYGSQNDELPLVQFDLTLRGGQLLDALDRVGVANLTATMLNRGTAKRTRADLEMAIEELGASIDIRANGENIRASGSTLARNYAPTIALLTEMLLEPRWDAEEFELAKLSASNEINAQLSDPNSIATNQYRHLIYGDEHVLSRNKLGTVETIAAITLDDLRRFYKDNLSPSIAKLHIVGSIDQEDALAALSAIEGGWAQSNVEIPDYKIPDMPETSQVYFYDVPGAKQSVLYFGYPALAETYADYYPAIVLNYILGGGGFASRLTQELREGKGYTYGIRSSFSGSTMRGPFTISSNVRSNVTLESALLIKDILEQYGDTFSTTDLDVTKNFMLKSKARSFETLAAKIGLLQDISAYGWPHDYVKEQDQIVRAMTVDRIQELAAKYLRPDRMIYLVVGDAESQYERLSQMGFGDAIKLN